MMSVVGQKGFRFFGGPLNGDYLMLGADFGDKLELEQYEYRESTETHGSNATVYCYIKRYDPHDSEFAYFYSREMGPRSLESYVGV